VTKSVRAYHSESDVCLLERRSVVGSVASNGDHLAVRVQPTVDDAFDEVVLVLWRRAGEYTQPWPHLVDQLLPHLLTVHVHISSEIRTVEQYTP